MPSERKSRLEIGFDDGKTTQDAIGPPARRPTSCGFADGVIGKACNPLKAWITSDKGQYVNQVKLGTAIGIMTNQNARNGQLAFLLLAFSCLAMFQPGCSKVQDIDQLRQAAEQGDASAQYNLGVMYANGEGVPEDYVKAYAWINLAAAQGQKDVVKSKDRLRPKMTSAQVAKAQELAGELYKRIEASKSR